jgi:hypothetical protein
MKITHRAFPVLLAVAACASAGNYQSHWILYPRPPAEAKAVAEKALRELGYSPSSPPGRDLVVEGRFAEGNRVIQCRIEIRPAGAECEVQVSTFGDVPESERQRVRNAHERLIGGLDAAMHR